MCDQTHNHIPIDQLHVCHSQQEFAEATGENVILFVS